MNFELILVQGARQGSSLSLLHADNQFPSITAMKEREREGGREREIYNLDQLKIKKLS
jgi:hypothetical protein